MDNPELHKENSRGSWLGTTAFYQSEDIAVQHISSGIYDCHCMNKDFEEIPDNDNPVWEKVAFCGPFITNGAMGDPSLKTTVAAFYDSEALYFNFQNEDLILRHGSDLLSPDPEKAKRSEPRIEIYLDPLREAGEMFYIACTIWGNIWTCHIAAGNDPEMSAKLIAPTGIVGKTSIVPTGWNAILMVPFAFLGQNTPESGAIWRINACHISFVD